MQSSLCDAVPGLNQRTGGEKPLFCDVGAQSVSRFPAEQMHQVRVVQKTRICDFTDSQLLAKMCIDVGKRFKDLRI